MSKQFLVLSHIWSKIQVCSCSFCTCSTVCDFHNNFLKEFCIDLSFYCVQPHSDSILYQRKVREITLRFSTPISAHFSSMFWLKFSVMSERQKKLMYGQTALCKFCDQIIVMCLHRHIFSWDRGCKKWIFTKDYRSLKIHELSKKSEYFI